MTTPSPSTVAAWRQKHPEYKTHRAAYQRQWRRKVKMQQLSLIPADVPPVEIEPKVRHISEKEVRRLEGLDRPAHVHVCHFYPPAYRCMCGKSQGYVPEVRRRVTFQPYERKEQTS